jgi:ketosteroid isomerase-like protein
MKLITSLLGIAGLSFATLALAQNEQTSPAPSTQQKEKPAAPAAKQKQPVASKATSSPATAPSKKMSVEATLKDNENRWEAAYAAHNTSVAESLVANDFSGVYWDGRVMDKSGVMSEMKKDKDTYKSAVNEKLAVRSYGPNVAVVIGTAHEKGTTKGGKPFDRMFRFTDTWVHRGGQWQCVASHIMKLRG